MLNFIILALLWKNFPLFDTNEIPSYLDYMVIRINFKRFVLYSSAVVLSICTAMRCKKDDYVYYDFEGLEGKKIDISLTPTDLSYKVGELISITGTMIPQEIGLEDFNSLEDPSLADFHFYNQNNLGNIDYEAFELVNFETEFNRDKTAYSIKYTYEIKKSGLYNIMNDPSFSSQNIYSLIYISVLTGKRKPRGYRGYVPLIFTNNGKSYIQIEVVDSNPKEG